MKCEFCDKSIVFPDDFTCKFCNMNLCSEHIQLEKHDCMKTTPVKHVRKKWLRKYGLNISSGKFKVVCDNCGYNSNPNLIEYADNERKNHIETSECSEDNVFLEVEEEPKSIPGSELERVEQKYDIVSTPTWMYSALEEAKQIIIKHHKDESRFLNSAEFNINIQTDKPSAYGYIDGTFPTYPIGIHKTLSDKTEENYRMVKIVLVHELLHAIHDDWTENQVSSAERRIANLAGYFDALRNMELLYLSGKMRLCDR